MRRPRCERSERRASKGRMSAGVASLKDEYTVHAPCSTTTSLLQNWHHYRCRCTATPTCTRDIRQVSRARAASLLGTRNARRAVLFSSLEPDDNYKANSCPGAAPQENKFKTWGFDPKRVRHVILFTWFTSHHNRNTPYK